MQVAARIVFGRAEIYVVNFTADRTTTSSSHPLFQTLNRHLYQNRRERFSLSSRQPFEHFRLRSSPGKTIQHETVVTVGLRSSILHDPNHHIVRDQSPRLLKCADLFGQGTL